MIICTHEKLLGGLREMTGKCLSTMQAGGEEPNSGHTRKENEAAL